MGKKKKLRSRYNRVWSLSTWPWPLTSNKNLCDMFSGMLHKIFIACLIEIHWQKRRHKDPHILLLDLCDIELWPHIKSHLIGADGLSLVEIYSRSRDQKFWILIRYLKLTFDLAGSSSKFDTVTSSGGLGFLLKVDKSRLGEGGN